MAGLREIIRWLLEVAPPSPPDLGVRLFDVFLVFAMYFFVCCVVRAPLILSPISHLQTCFVHVCHALD